MGHRPKQLFVILSWFVVATQANLMATFVAPYGSDGRGTGLQTKLNSRVTAGTGDVWNPGVANGASPADYINGTVQNQQSAQDVTWGLTGPNSSSATIVLEIAGYANQNTFGFYDPADPSRQAQLFSGPAGVGSRVYVRFSGGHLQSSSDGVTFSDVAGGAFSSTSFGLYLHTPANKTFFSDPGLNQGNDNLVAYQGFGTGNAARKLTVGGNTVRWDSGSYVVAWEDLPLGGSDKDYQDMVVLMSNITPVPETSTFVLAGLLLIPVLVQVRRLRRSA